jgi:molybdopterin synthase sulfur carrier subunit
MVTTTAILMGQLRGLAGRREVQATLPAGSTVREFIDWLTTACGEAFARQVVTSEGSLLPTVAVFLNGRDLRDLGGLETELVDGQVQMVILPVFEGGD